MAKHSVVFDAWISSETDTTATIGWEAYVQFGDWYLWGVRLEVWIDGSKVSEKAGYTTSGYQTCCYQSGYTTVSKGSSGRTISCGAWSYSQTVDGIGGVGEESYQRDNQWVSAIAYKTPHNAANVVASRESDSKNTLSWSQDGTGYEGLYPWNGYRIDRRIDGGAWSNIATIASWNTYGYTDSTTSANHSYQYRVRTYGPGGTSSGTASGTLYNTPCAPEFSGVSRVAETTIEAALRNDANTATALEVERSTDKKEWTAVGSFDGKVTSFQDSPGGGTYYYRARNARGSLVSEWAYSEAVVTICAPAAPTLKAPASGSVMSKAVTSFDFEWAHNPIDGSAQEKAQLRYSTDGGGTYTTVSIDGGAQSLAMDNSFDVNSTVTWSVRTKGVHDDFGPWAGNRVFYVRQVPTVFFEEPADGFVVEDVPVHVKLAYSDPSGTLADASVSVLDSSGRQAFSKACGKTIEFDISAAEWLPEDGESYTLVANVRSSSSLSANASRDVTVDFVPPQAAWLSVEPKRDTGYVEITVGLESDPDMVDADRITLYRVSEAGRIELMDEISVGAIITDRFAPINVPYRYEAVTQSDSGAVNCTKAEVTLKSPWWFMYFGESDMAKGKWNPEWSFKMSRHSKVRETFAGRKWQVSFDDEENRSMEGSLSLVLAERDERMAFERLIDAGGRCVFKSGDGDVFHADVDADFAPQFESRAYWGTVSASVVRIDGDAL